MEPCDDQARVLVVDDVAEIREMLVAHLELDGYKAASASDAIQALKMVDSFVPHCVVLDIQMPGTDGLEFARVLRKRFGDDVVLIAITGQPVSDKRVDDTFRLVDHYLQKPIDLNALRRALPPA